MTEQDKQNHFLNLISRGFSMREARKRVGYEDPAPPPASAPEVVESPIEEKKAVRAKLKDLGVKYSPNASLENLQAKLEDAL